MEDVPVQGTISYHVFINQRGLDVNKTLGSLIYRELTGFGLRVFLSDNEHQLPEIISAIETASVHIAIFSERYSESRPCLNELCWILKSSAFIPLFCNVEPLDLRDIERGCYAESFHKHQQNDSVTMETVQRWKRALYEASQMSGHVFKTNESDHGEFLDRIVEIVLDKVEWEPIKIARHPVMGMKTPKLSYEALDRTGKEILLDIGSFFEGEDTELVTRVLEGLGWVDASGYLENLLQKCLIIFQTKQSDGETEERPQDSEKRSCNYYYRLPPKRSYEIVTMNDQIRDFARNIVREEFCYPLRLGCLNDIQKKVEFQDGEDSGWIRGIRTSNWERLPEYPNYIKGVGVRHLVIEYPNENLWSLLEKSDMRGDLIWLRLRLSNFSSVFLPSTVSLATLRALELKVKVKNTGGEFDVEDLECFFRDYISDPPSHLTELNIDLSEDDPTFSSMERWAFLDDPMRFSEKESIPQAPDCLGRFVESLGTSMTNLQKIVLKDIKFLETLPDNFGDLQNLRHLDLSGCNYLNELPNSFSQLLQLRFLSLQGCLYLSIRLDMLGEISTLEYVDFEGCCKLEELPLGISHQRSLRYLNVLCTPLMQLPENIELLEKLEQLRIGSPELTELPHSLSNLSSLTELTLMSCYKVKQVLSDAIKWPNIKVLGIYTMEIENLPFRVCMSFLRQLTVNETWISEICIPEIFCPMLEIVDLSNNFRLTRIEDLPSTVVTLDLKNCSKLQTLTNLSNLANLRYINITQCYALETLNVEGMQSLEEIKALSCWNLQRINGLTRRQKRLNSLQISTDNAVIWKDICKFLTSPSEISTVILTTRADDEKNKDEEAMRNILSNLENVEVLDEFSAETRGGGFYKKLGNAHSYGAILMCFITYGSVPFFEVRFESDKIIGPRYVTQGIVGSSGRYLHVYFWTEDSNRLREYDIVVSSRLAPTESVGKRWIVMLSNKTDVFELCNQVLSALAPGGFHLYTSKSDFDPP